MSEAAQPPSGIRVIELARILAAPWAGQVLADLGADVIKVEQPALWLGQHSEEILAELASLEEET